MPTGVSKPLPAATRPAVEVQHAQHPTRHLPQEVRQQLEEHRGPDRTLATPHQGNGPGSKSRGRTRSPRPVAQRHSHSKLTKGKDSRMVLDSSVCNVNPRCFLPEPVCLPTSTDIRTTFKPLDPPNASQGAALDFKAAHKRVKVRQWDQGLLLLAGAGISSGVATASDAVSLRERHLKRQPLNQKKQC